MSPHHTPFFRQVAAAEARRRPCPECGGRYSDKYDRPFHEFTCSRYILPSQRIARRPTEAEEYDRVLEAQEEERER